ncbi:hypothetical protein [Pseudobacteriovorax antillogorgiicola]|uniref:Uncharacterized protein n=1 Tax=Pseudobacteriovorax antillogorgiicola TaxID=1513793 RepID=A0A1Y6CC43_9BACT|nr:hypothetical protein [Pseudobacteriovorax antillogorgiicola]TCS48337.1 hypothetical protein EDD56_118117 [Pseudobacteriovorax antillogorgiicola]SMF56409.1 hypothetical protein SAMN06296036_11824 [Pseudobacteriovorax antillogorgiicola]
MRKVLPAILFIFLGSGCNESSFTEGAAPVNEEEELSQDAQAKTAESNVTVLPTTILEETTVEARNPFEAADSQLFSFIAAQEAQGAFQFSLDDKKLATTINLTNNYSNKTDNHNQIVRTPLMDMKTQGTPGQAYNEMFDQETSKGLLDILVVIDNSGSMSQEQNNLSTKLSSLLSAVTDTDWQIAFTTTDPSDSCIHRLITTSDQDADQLFKDAVKVGTSGSGNEQGIRRAVEGLACSSTPWVRTDSSIAVLIVSDEDNCSDGNGCGNDPWNTQQYLIDYMQNTLNRTVGMDAGFYGIFSDPADPCSTAYKNAAQYKALVEYNANGQKNYGDICDNDYSTTLNLISQNISKILRAQWELTAIPDAGSLVVEVEVNGVKTAVDAGDYTLNGKTLTFNQGKEPPVNSKIHASYTQGKTTMFSTMDLAEKPAAGTLSVKVNGVALNAGQYTLNGQTITFDPIPAANAVVIAEYRRDTALLKEFSVQGTPRANAVKVFVEDVETNNFTYAAATKKVTLTDAPADGYTVKITYENLDGPQLAYNVMIGGQNPRDFKLFYNDTELSFEKQANTITINAADHEENRKLTLKYEADDTEEKMFTLPQTPLENTLEVLSGVSDCMVGNGFELMEANLKSTCIVDAQTEFDVSYTYVALRNEFDAASVLTPNQGTWKIYVDGQLFTDYTREGTFITLTGELPIGAKVDVYYEFGN